MNRSFLYFLLLLFPLILNVIACTDWRNDALEVKEFDPSLSFIRFNYGNGLTTTTQEEIHVPSYTDSSLILPIAASTPPLDEPIRIRWDSTCSGLSDIRVLYLEDSLPVLEEIEIPAGHFITELLVLLPSIDTGMWTMELTEVSPSLILGYPNSGGRGKTVTINVP